VAAITFATFGVLYGIVRSGSRTIARQHHELSNQLAEVARVSAQNQALCMRIQSTSQRASETNERVLRRVSTELHDGPAQALALASLRLESLARRAATDANDTEAAELRATLDEAMRDIRNLCRGLALPEIEGQTIGAVLELAIQTHERRTGTTVTRNLERSSAVAHSAPHPTLIWFYRFVQEGLMNAFRHADGIDQQVICRIAEGRLEVVVADGGPGFEPACRDVRAPGQVLNGLRERVESIGGEFRIESDARNGTRLSMTFGHGE
jgi:signal transduction histidine kinase